jgi:release factor glutamine methyltransferase
VDRATLVAGDWCAGLEEQFDLIVANPPYVAADEIAGLEPEVRLHEPLAALCPDGDVFGDGLGAYRRISSGIGAVLAPGGRFLLEIGPQQAAEVTRILANAGIAVTGVLPDMDGRDRVVCACI